MNRFIVSLSLAMVVAGCPSSSSTTRAFCEKSISCDPDTDENSPEEQSEIDTCVENQEGFLRELRAHDDAACADLAAAFDAQNVCNAALECDELNAPRDSTCADERAHIDAACDAVVGTDCEADVALNCGLGGEP